MGFYRASEDLTTFSQCYEKLAQHCKEDENALDCYKKHKGRFQVCQSKEVASLFKIQDNPVLADEDLVKSRCYTRLLKDCPRPSGPTKGP